MKRYPKQFRFRTYIIDGYNATRTDLIVLANDNTMWFRRIGDEDWNQMIDLPQPPLTLIDSIMIKLKDLYKKLESKLMYV